MELSKDLLKYYGNKYVLLYNYHTNKICLIKKREFDLLEQGNMNEIRMCEKEWAVLVKKGIVILNQGEYQSMSYIGKYREQIKNRNFKIDTVYFHVTQRCNLQCEYCYNKSNLNKTEELATEKVFQIIDILKKASVKNIILTGGEALLRKDIIDVAEYIKREGFSLTVLTNGVLLGAKSQILKYIDSAIISIDTFDAQKNLRKGLDIDALIKNLKGIEHSLRSKIYLRCVISKQDMDSWKNVKEFCKQNNYKFLKSIYIPGSKDEIELVPTIESVNDNEESSENTTNMGGSVCGASYREIAIDANGDVYPCQMLISEQWKLGNIFEENYFVHHNYPEIVSLFKRRNLDTIPSCNMCEYKYLCGGGCPAISYYLYKDTQVAPRVACDFIKAEIDVKMVRMLKKYEKKF